MSLKRESLLKRSKIKLNKLPNLHISCLLVAVVLIGKIISFKTKQK